MNTIAASTAAEIVRQAAAHVAKSRIELEKHSKREPEINDMIDYLHSTLYSMYDNINAARIDKLPEALIEGMLEISRPVRHRMKLEEKKLARLKANILKHEAIIGKFRVFSILNDEQTLNHARWLISVGEIQPVLRT